MRLLAASDGGHLKAIMTTEFRFLYITAIYARDFLYISKFLSALAFYEAFKLADQRSPLRKTFIYQLVTVSRKPRPEPLTTARRSK